MKKNLLGWFALATMLVGTGCSSDEVVNDYSPENAIEFGTYVGRGAESRAYSITEPVLKNEGFGVYAYYTGQNKFSDTATPNFMKNEWVRYSSTDGWFYEPVKYWPNNVGDHVSFFAYAPYSETSPLNSTAGDPIISYTDKGIENASDLEGSDEAHYDLLYADVTEKTKDLTKQKIEDKVEFKFLHALSRIGFNVEAIVDEVANNATGSEDDKTDANGTTIENGTTITIEKVELIGAFYNFGQFNLNTETWTGTGYTVGNTTFVLNSDDFSSTNVTTTKTQLNDVNSYLMIIPKEFKDSDLLKIRATYKVTTIDTKLDGEKSEITNVVESAPFGLNFIQGNAYMFSLQIGLTSVKFSVSVDDWNTGSDIAVNVPINE